MGELFNGVDWARLFVPNTPALETFVRGSLVYLGAFVLLRVILKREAGGLGITDILVIVFIADAAQNAMSDDYRSIPDGLLLVATLVGWDYVLDRLAFRFPAFERLLKPPPLLLIEHGRMLPRNMRHEFITEADLLALLREQGIDDIGEVRQAFMEADGRVSVIQNAGHGHDGPPPDL